MCGIEQPIPQSNCCNTNAFQKGKRHDYYCNKCKKKCLIHSPKQKQSKISIEKYNEIMASIIKKGKPVADTLVEMLEEASKYKLPKSIKKSIKKSKKK